MTLTAAPGRPAHLYRSTIGKKIVMAVSGVVLYGYVIAHLAGNLKIFLGEEHLNEYGEGLRRLGEPILGHEWFLWAMRPILLAAVLAHIWSAYQLTRISRAARGEDYKVIKPAQASYASRTMRWGGVIIALFIVYHLLHMTFGVEPIHNDFEHGEIYSNLIHGLGNPLVAGFYILANLALGLHLYHGGWSMLQTLGRNSPRWDPVIRRGAAGLALLITLGNISIPIAVLTGVVD